MKPDKWQLKLIHAIKREADTLLECRKIWAERCALSLEHVEIRHINRNLFELSYEMGLIDANFIFTLDPEDDWKFGFKRKSSFDEILFSRLCSLFYLLEVKKIPGYKELDF